MTQRWTRWLGPLAVAASLAIAPDVGAQDPRSLAPAALARAACGDRQPCRVEEVLDAGRDAAGRRLRVARLLLSAPSHPHADGSPAFGGECARFEWVLVTDGARPSARPLVEICNDGYGARGVGEDTVAVSENRFTHTRVGGSAWGWSETITLSLSPLAVVDHESGGWWSLGPNTATSSISYPTLTASGSWWSPMCGPGGDAPFDLGEGEAVRWIAIPRVTLGASELAALREGASLGTCAARIDGSAPRATTLGPEADPTSASLRALWPFGAPLVVDIEDDSMTERDGLEIWVGGERPSYMDHCRDPSEVTSPRGAFITVADGGVRPIGAPGLTVPVERLASGDRVRFLVSVPEDARTMTLVYRDADGDDVVRTLASSRLDVADAASLGELASLPRATCAIERGALRPNVVELTAREGRPAIEGP